MTQQKKNKKIHFFSDYTFTLVRFWTFFTNFVTHSKIKTRTHFYRFFSLFFWRLRLFISFFYIIFTKKKRLSFVERELSSPCEKKLYDGNEQEKKIVKKILNFFAKLQIKFFFRKMRFCGWRGNFLFS